MWNDCVRTYYKELKALFPSISYYDMKFLKDFKSNLREYSATILHCTYEKLVEEFGTPEEIFQEYMEEIENNGTVVVQGKDHTKKWVLILVASTLAILIIIYTAFWYDFKKKAEEAIPDEIETIIIEED